MKKFKNSGVGFLLFFLTVTFNSSLAVLLYSLIKEQSDGFISIVLIMFIFLSASLCATIDFIRRKLTVDKPVKEIRDATKKMANGNFNIQLYPSSKHGTSTYDQIKVDLNILASELSKMEVFKTDFISNVSHEIKTPLSIIQNYTKELGNKSLSEEVREKYLLTLDVTCKKLTNLVTNILKLNKLENGAIIPEYKSFNLSESIINQILSFESIFEQKSIDLNCNIEENVFFLGEESYLEIIWSNLISNAIKFTEPEGQINISLRKEFNKIIFTIQDTGCGINEEIGQHIFDKFYQGDTSHSHEGNGLGLALVKKVIDIIGGTISVKSQKNKGTTFIVEIKE
ncbi:MAG: HAMP domain-containing histidine kinase [Anaeroplasmataceae bacterium]|nr:HAMP domain-containing histidine kinase [Anaeroplasmataceae bacterium]